MAAFQHLSVFFQDQRTFPFLRPKQPVTSPVLSTSPVGADRGKKQFCGTSGQLVFGDLLSNAVKVEAIPLQPPCDRQPKYHCPQHHSVQRGRPTLVSWVLVETRGSADTGLSNRMHLAVALIVLSLDAGAHASRACTAVDGDAGSPVDS